MSRTTFRAWFKGVRSPAGVLCCDISDGHRTEYDVRAGAYWVPINWLVVAGAAKKAIIRNAGNRLAKPSSGMPVFAAVSKIRCFVRAMRVSGVPAPFARGCGILIAEQLSPFWSLDQSDSVLLPTVTCLNYSSCSGHAMTSTHRRSTQKNISKTSCAPDRMR